MSTKRNLISLILIFAATWRSVYCGVVNTDAIRKCQTNPTKKATAILDLPSVDSSIPSFRAGDIGTALKDTLKERTTVAQKPVLLGLKAIDPDFDIQTFWIVNRIAVKDVPCTMLPTIASIPQPFNVRMEKVMDVSMLMDSVVVHAKGDSADGNPQWGIQKINAPNLWSTTKGEGVVVSSIDTGVRGSHEALSKNYRGNYDFGWMDGISNSSKEGPNDGMGHGSHVMGTICGGNGIGVAPGATWMACKGCNNEGKCIETGLLTCGQWAACPYMTTENGTNVEDCTKRPDVIANSWGSLIGTDPFYNEIIDHWRTAGIVPVFAIGNTGPVCMTTGSPGNQDKLISVGATDNKDKIARFSSRGPPSSGGNATTKPEVSAPGKDILSAWFKSDSSYSTISGTSMACPHVGGAVALLLAKSKALTFAQIEKTLEETAFRPSGLSPWDTCSFQQWPNNAYGYGRIDVEAAYKGLPDVPSSEP